MLGYYVSNRDEAYTTNGFLDVPVANHPRVE